MSNSTKWNKDLAAEYRRSAEAVKQQIARLNPEIAAHSLSRGCYDSIGLKLLKRRYELRKILTELTETAYKLDHYYDQEGDRELMTARFIKKLSL